MLYDLMEPSLLDGGTCDRARRIDSLAYNGVFIQLKKGGACGEVLCNADTGEHALQHVELGRREGGREMK
jgi:hypothetical protein